MRLAGEVSLSVDKDCCNKISKVYYISKMIKNNSIRSDNKIKIRVGGMSCVKCVDRVSKAIKKVDGVKEVVVNLGTETASVQFEEGYASVDKLKTVIEEAGYNYMGLIEELPTIEQKRAKEKEQSQKLHRIIAGFVGGTILMILMYIPDTLIFDKSILMFVISVPFFIYVSYPIYQSAIRDIISSVLSMDVMYAMGISVAYLSSILGTFELVLTKDFMFYETAVFLATFLSLGRYLEAKGRSRTSKAIEKLLNLRVSTAWRLKVNYDEVESGEKSLEETDMEEVAIEDVQVGDIVFVKPGQKIPADGVVLDGSSYVDESMLTGEPIPVLKGKGATVIGGTINKNSVLIVRVNKVGKDTMLSQIIAIVEDALNKRPPIQKIADRVVSYFIPAILIIAGLSFAYWYLIVGSSLLLGLTVLISVLVIACPCALGLATPMAMMVGIGRGAEKGILIKSGEVFERSYKITSVVFDKTGTLTEGKPNVYAIHTYDMPPEQLLQIAASIEKNSQHPLAEAIIRKAVEKGINLIAVNNFNTYEGKGVIAEINGSNVIIGNEFFLREKSIKFNEKWQMELNKLSGENILVYVAIDGQLKGVIEIADTIKVEAKGAIEELKKMGMKVVMITGDKKGNSDVIAKRIGIDEVIAEVLPHEKANEIIKMRDKGEVVAFVGDGINDAPALAASDIGIALASGTDIAIETGDVVLMRNNLIDVVSSIKLSRRIMVRIKKNIFWAFAYNVLLIPIAAGALYPIWGILLKPELAGLAMAFSSVTVVSLSRRI